MTATVPLILAEEDIERGGKEQSEHDIQNDFAYNNNVHNATITIRMGFLRKVYGLLSMQLLMTVAVGSIFMMSSTVKLYVQENLWTMALAFILTIGILVGLLFKRKDHPTNLILLVIFTLVQSYTVGVVVSMYDTSVVLEALFITLTVLLALTAYTFQTKRDFSFMGFGLFIGLWCLLIGGFIQIFAHSTALELAISIGGALLFCLFIVFDTQMIMHTLSAEEYILATINIYLDIINLFLHILRALAISKQ
ncbi:protein lifeguard 4 isoform X2 [Harpegnathos saltator]|uniref:Transmembrane BAX inhibitor motif-containing protein 4 n=2 Tax=Harpegnathos saltator TaxID=610380 RepID=E2C4P8_HARSA|nr:protein lifeguard 4 isoform X2 [Harpegnathos saltator]XP_011150727.1 protein lifeguard 4 isoform X2 [Harpegnathos saltator]EFN77089.1 Transmembrane BAX inhibitor motif-containing protein 4 [Harpegnathos saltator]